MGMTAPKRGGMSETPNPHAAHLNHDSDCDRFACQFLVRSFFVGVVSICYITLGCVREMLYRVTYALSDDNRNTPVRIVYQRADAVRTLSRDI